MPADPLTSLTEAVVHAQRAARWLQYGIDGTVPLPVALYMHLHHRQKAIAWLIGLPPPAP